jgi:S-DNA-T family DNA segregation ATPase FtsK/SpoIIIE
MDELLKEAIEITIERGQGSISLLQRKLCLGYNRAGRLMDTMYELGVVGELTYLQPREVLINDISEVNFETLNQ